MSPRAAHSISLLCSRERPQLRAASLGHHRQPTRTKLIDLTFEALRVSAIERLCRSLEPVPLRALERVVRLVAGPFCFVATPAEFVRARMQPGKRGMRLGHTDRRRAFGTAAACLRFSHRASPSLFVTEAPCHLRGQRGRTLQQRCLLCQMKYKQPRLVRISRDAVIRGHREECPFYCGRVSHTCSRHGLHFDNWHARRRLGVVKFNVSIRTFRPRKSPCVVIS